MRIFVQRGISNRETGGTISFVQYTAIFLLILLSGCATFRDGPNPPITKWPPEDGSNKTIAIQVKISAKAIMNNLQWDVLVLFPERWRKEVIRAYETAGLFSAVKPSSEMADIRAEVDIIGKRVASIGLAFLSWITMSIIPIDVREGFIVKTTYKDKNGNILGSFEKSEFSTTWVQLFLLPVTPFQFLVAKDMLFDLNRNTILEAHGKGIY